MELSKYIQGINHGITISENSILNYFFFKNNSIQFSAKYIYYLFIKFEILFQGIYLLHLYNVLLKYPSQILNFQTEKMAVPN